MARPAGKKKQTGALLFVIGILFVAAMTDAFVWMIALQKQWTDFKIDLAEAAAEGAAENTVIVQDGNDIYILHAQNCRWLCSQIMAAKQLPFHRETPETYDLLLVFPNGSTMDLAGSEENGVLLSFTDVGGKRYRFALGDLAQWDTYYELLTEGFAYKNVSASPDSLLIP